MYRLDQVLKICEELKFKAVKIDPQSVEVSFDDCGTLVLQNLQAEDDTIMGFKDTPWHTHGTLMLLTEECSDIEYDEIELLVAIRNGEVLIASQYKEGVLVDRFFEHRDNKLDLSGLKPGEELRIKRYRK